MTEKKDPNLQAIFLVVGAWIITMVGTILIIVLATSIFIDTTKCSSLGQALPVLWGIIAILFFASVIVVKVIAWKIMPSTTGRWVILGVYSAVMLVSFVVIAFMLLIFFNC